MLLSKWLNVTNSFLSLALLGLARHLTDSRIEIRADGMYFSNQCIWSFRDGKIKVLLSGDVSEWHFGSADKRGGL